MSSRTPPTARQSRFPGPGGGVPKPVPDLGERLFDRVQVRTVRRQEEHVRAGYAVRREDDRALVAGQAVHHDHVTRAQRFRAGVEAKSRQCHAARKIVA
ncbi:MAG: hypothetical protein OXJ64_07040 [Boseongicola sp.]|nr:hypothetical protein [Boseongicola sp.]